MRVLYLDCFAGISGDMTLGAFLDLGVKEEVLINELKKLNIDGYEIEVSKKSKSGIEGTDVKVHLDSEGHEHHHHDEHTHGHHHTHHEHEHDHSHHHHHEDDHGDHGHTHTHDRNLVAIEKIINESELDGKVKELSKAIFQEVAKAEAKIHGKPIDEVHFHEVGAVDSIVDIVGAAICLNELEVDKIVSSPLHVGTGFVECQHGVIPIPAPATLEILRDSKVPFYSKGIDKELVTPTGAAIVAALASEYGPMPEGTAIKVGYGLGKRDLKIANLLRMVLIDVKKKQI